MKKFSLKSAYTMAEVLLVLAIIGITAALAIPNLKQSYNEEEYIAKLRATIPALKTAYIKAKAEYGDTLFDLKHVAKFLNVAKICSTPTECLANKPVTCKENFSSSYCSDDHLYYETSHVSSGYFYYGVILQNGVSIVQANRACNFDSDYGERIFIDLDNIKGPSQYGVDFYELYNIDYDNDNQEFNSLLSSENLDYGGLSWAMIIGNMDYLRCSDELSWEGKHTCE